MFLILSVVLCIHSSRYQSVRNFSSHTHQTYFTQVCLQNLCLDHLRCNIISLFSLFYEILSGLGSLLRMPCFLCFTSAVTLTLYVLGTFVHIVHTCIFLTTSGKNVDFISYKSTLWKNQSCKYIYSSRLISDLFATPSFMLCTKQSHCFARSMKLGVANK